MRLLLTIEAVIQRAADRITVPANEVRTVLVHRQGVPAGKIDVVAYPQDPHRYDLSAEDIEVARHKIGAGDRLVIGTFSRLHVLKGHRYLLEAAARLWSERQDLLFLIVGDGPERANLEDQINARGLSDVVRILGFREDVLAIMAASDMVVQPTLHEAFSRVMIEAFWLNRPLIITDVSGVSDLVVNEVNALVVAKADAQALSAAIRRLANDAVLRDNLAARGRVHVEQTLAPAVLIPQYEACYRLACNGASHVKVVSSDTLGVPQKVERENRSTP